MNELQRHMPLKVPETMAAQMTINAAFAFVNQRLPIVLPYFRVVDQRPGRTRRQSSSVTSALSSA